MDPISQTSRWTAAARARESARPDRLFDDPFAERLATERGFELLEAMTTINGENPFIAVRTRFLDDFLRGAVGEGSQVVMIAAGVDARPYRMPWPADVTWYELDRPEVLVAKRDVLADAAPHCAVRAVPVDLRGDWEPALLAAGFDRERPAISVAEGLVIYFADDDVRDLLSRVAHLSAPGSSVALDIPGRSLLSSELLKETRSQLEAMNAPWRFGTDDPEGLLEGCGWRKPAVVRPGDPEVHYGRWPWPIAPRGTPGVPESFFVIATR